MAYPLAQATHPAFVIPAGKMAFATANAIMNGTSTVLLAVALTFIKKGNWKAHACTMVVALIVSAAFLVSYLTSWIKYEEVTVGAMSGGAVPNWAKGLYLIVLLPHLLAAIIMLPMIGTALYLAWNREWQAHKKIATPTWYLWFYVSLSGVLVYWMLYHWIPSFRAT